MGYVPKIVKELYAALSGETTITSSERVEVTIRGQEFEFSPARINEYLNLDPLTEYEIEADETIDALSNEELIDFLTEGTLSLKNLTTRPQYPCKAAFVILSAYNWVPLSHKNAVQLTESSHLQNISCDSSWCGRDDLLTSSESWSSSEGRRQERYEVTDLSSNHLWRPSESTSAVEKAEGKTCVWDPIQEGFSSWWRVSQEVGGRHSNCRGGSAKG